MLKTVLVCSALALAPLSPAFSEDAGSSAPAIQTSAAVEVPQAVKDACKDDYEKHCSKHEPESTAARDCMAGAFEKLSDPCVTAILDSPLVDEPPQQLATAPSAETEGSKPAAAAETNRKEDGAHAIPKAASQKVAAHTAKAHHAPNAKVADAGSSAHKSARHSAHRERGSQRTVAAKIRRGTSIANYYVTKYTRFALAKVFR